MGCGDGDVVRALVPILGDRTRDVRVITDLSTKKSRAFLLCLPEDGPARECVMVAKIYRDEGRALREAEVLAALASAGVAVPAACGATPTVLLRRYVYGPVLRDVHWTLELARKLGAWLYSCHEALRLAPQGVGGYGRTRLVGDMNLSNFVIDVAQADGDEAVAWRDCGTRGIVCGIDFGDTRVGDPLEDVGEGFMRILSHRPGYTMERQACAAAFVWEYGRLSGAGDMVWSEVERHVLAAFRRVAAWRRDPFMNDVAEAVGAMWGSGTPQIDWDGV